MNFQFSETASQVSVKITGELDFASNVEFKKIIDQLAGHKGKTITIDLAGVSRIDSVGLGLLYIAKEEANPSNGRICLKAPQTAVMRMLELTEADTDFDIETR